jgi:acetolactate synthase-1/2/3 large subunit
LRLPPHEPEVAELLAGADALVVVGSDMDGMTTKNHTLALPGLVVSVNVDEEKAAVPGRPDAVRVVADARWAFERLLERLEPRRGGLAALAPAAGERAWARICADERTAPAGALVEVVERVAGDAVVVNDMTVAGYWLGGYLRPGGARRMQDPRGGGTLGYALPAAVGAAHAGRPVLAVCGDGGFAFAVGELATLVQERLAVTVLVVDDAGYGMLRFDQRHDDGPRRGTDLVVPDFVALAGAYGIPGVCVDEVGAPLARALADALGAGAPRLVHLRAGLYPPRTTTPRWNEP